MRKNETSNGKKGGLLKGKAHYDKNGKPLGGIKAVVTDTNTPVELEGGEVIINKHASKKYWKELSKINQSAGNGVPINNPNGGDDEDPEEYKDGGRIIDFNPNHLPNKRILTYAKKIKSDYPKVWDLGGNIFGNEAFKNLQRVSERGYWLDSEKWMYIKWRSFVARHTHDFRIKGVIAMLKWVDKVDKGWDYMKDLIEAEIEKKYPSKMEKGGQIKDLINNGIVELKMFDTKTEHAREYGLDAKNPLYIQSIYIDKNQRLKGIGTKVLNHIDEYAIKNGNDVIFGHITQKAEITKDSRNTTSSNVDILKNWLKDNGYIINNYNNDFYKYVKDEMAKGGKLIKRADGTYSKRGLWDNIRDNIGSGKKPTKQMLEQEKKIKAKMGKGGELVMGIKSEKEHIDTARKLYNHKITPEESAKVIAQDHLKESENYYTELAKMEKKFADGGILENNDTTYVYPSTSKPIFWQMTMKQFCDYAKSNNLDTRIEGTNAKLQCEDFYKYTIVQPLLSDKAERNVYLLAIQSNRMPYELVEEIIRSVDMWGFVKKVVEIIQYNNQHKNNAEIWQTPKDLYLQKEVFNKNYTKEQADKWYKEQIYNNVYVLDTILKDLISRGLVKYSDVISRIRESIGIENLTKEQVKELDVIYKIQQNKKVIYKLNYLIDLIESEKVYTSQLQHILTKKTKEDWLNYKSNFFNDEKDLIIQKGSTLPEDADYDKMFEISKSNIQDKMSVIGAELVVMGRYYDPNYDDIKRYIKYGKSVNDISDVKAQVEELIDYGFQVPKEVLDMLKSNKIEEPQNYLTPNKIEFINTLIDEIKNDSTKHNKTSLEKLGRQFDIQEQNTIKELAELSISLMAREIAHNNNLSNEEKYYKIVDLYNIQPNLTHRTSQSMMMQQYSTPAPIGYLMGLYCGIDKKAVKYFEPSAGNGLLTSAGYLDNGTLNELDKTRNEDLHYLGFKNITNLDASEPFPKYAKTFDAVITNPPFGSVDSVFYGKYEIKSLEQLMALRGLDTLKDDGKSAIIIGGWMEYDSEGRLRAGKNRIFFVYLYENYNIEDIINIDGQKLYSRQGTAFPTRVILINGRKKEPKGYFPLLNKELDKFKPFSNEPIRSFDDLWTRINNYI